MKWIDGRLTRGFDHALLTVEVREERDGHDRLALTVRPDIALLRFVLSRPNREAVLARKLGIDPRHPFREGLT